MSHLNLMCSCEALSDPTRVHLPPYGCLSACGRIAPGWHVCSSCATSACCMLSSSPPRFASWCCQRLSVSVRTGAASVSFLLVCLFLPQRLPRHPCSVSAFTNHPVCAARFGAGFIQPCRCCSSPFACACRCSASFAAASLLMRCMLTSCCSVCTLMHTSASV